MKTSVTALFSGKHVDETIIFSPIITDVVISPLKEEFNDPIIGSNKDPIIKDSTTNNWDPPAEDLITNDWTPTAEVPITDNWAPHTESHITSNWALFDESPITNNWDPYVEDPITNFGENLDVDSTSSNGAFMFFPPETSLVGESKQGAELPSNLPSDPFLADNETLVDSFIAAPPAPVVPSETDLQTNPALTLMSIIQMKKANLSQDLINAYLADGKCAPIHISLKGKR